MTNNEFTVCYAELVHELINRKLIPSDETGWSDIFNKYPFSEEDYLKIKDTARKSREARMVKTQREELSRGTRICKVALEKVQRGEMTEDDIYKDMASTVIYNYIVIMSVAKRLNTKKAFYDLGIRELSIKYAKRHTKDHELLQAS